MFDDEINRKGTYCTQWDYVQDRFGELDLLPFTISDMDFSVPPVVLQAIEKRIQHPVFGYSRWNHSDFKGSIVYWFKNRFNAEFDEEELVYGPSVIYIISQLIRHWSNSQEGIIVYTPAYDAFDNMIRGLNRNIVEHELKKNSTGYSLDWNLLKKQLANKNNTILLICSPHNPTGKVWDAKELHRMATLCKKHNVAVISDEIHMDICFKPHTPWQGFGYGKHWALVSSASKSFNIPALNGAYAFIADSRARKNYLFNLKQVDGLSSPSIFGVLALMAAYQHGESWLEKLKLYLFANHKYVKQTLHQELPEIEYQIPDATYLAWIDLSPLSIDMEELNQCLIKKHKVAIMQGKTYGIASAQFIRLNLGCRRAKLEQGINALILAIKELKK